MIYLKNSSKAIELSLSYNRPR